MACLKNLHSFFLLTFTITAIAPNMFRHMNDLPILYSVVGWYTIILTTFAIFCHILNI